MPAEPCLHRRNEFRGINRLHQIVVRTEIHPGAQITPLVPAGKKDERQVGGARLGAQGFQHAMTIHFRHRDIAHDQIGVFFAREFDAFPTIASFDDRKTFQTEQRGELLSQFGFIIDDENAFHVLEAEDRLGRSKETSFEERRSAKEFLRDQRAPGAHPPANEHMVGRSAHALPAHSAMRTFLAE